MKTLLRRILASLGLFTKTECDAHFTEGYFLGVKSVSIGISRDSKGRFRKAKP